MKGRDRGWEKEEAERKGYRERARAREFHALQICQICTGFI